MERIAMSQEERDCLDWLKRAKAGSMSQREAAEKMGMGVNNQGGAGGQYGPNQADHQFTDKLSTNLSVTWVRGSHTFKSGAEFKQDVYTDDNFQGAFGNYGFGNGRPLSPPCHQLRWAQARSALALQASCWNR